MSHNTLSPSSIDFLTSCSTGVDLIPGYASVHYWVYSTERVPDQLKAADPKTLEDALFEAQIAIRDKKHIVYHDEARKALWFFAGTPYTPGLYPPELGDGSTGIENYGWQFKIIFSGMFRPNELNIHPARLAAMHAASQPPTPSGLPSSGANARSLQQNTTGSAAMLANVGAGPSIDRSDIRMIYGFFIKAVQTSFAYTLAREQKALQLDCRTYVMYSSAGAGADADESFSSPLPTFTVDQTLANGGGLLISTNIIDNTVLYCCSPHSANQYSSTEAIISPGGAVVEILTHSDQDDSLAVQRWKSLVKKQLRARGIDLSLLEPQDQWLLVKLQDSDSRGDDVKDHSVVFYWPLSLCFTHRPFEQHRMDEGSTALHQEQDSSGLSWFASPENEGEREPVRFAQEWYDAKSARDQAVEERRKQLELEKKQLEVATLGVPSPSFPRDGLQATAGVYPTPPDGVPHANHGSGNADASNVPLSADQAAHRSSLDMQHSEMMDLDIGPFEENVRQRPSVISRSSLDGGVKLGGDDLFGEDMVDDDLRGQDITDADFSFFDEPDGPDELMLDDIAEESVEDQARQESMDDGDAKAANAALHKATLGDSEANGSIEVGAETVHENVPASDKQMEPSMLGTDDTSMNDVVIEENGPTIAHGNVTLSPSVIQRNLFDSSMQPLQQTRRASQFQPLAFNSVMRRNDAKYSLDGAFAFKMHSPGFPEARSATSAQIKPRPPDFQARQVFSRPRKPLTSPNRANGAETDSSSSFSDSSDDESVYGVGMRSAVSSSTKARLLDNVSGAEVQSPAGTNVFALEEFNIASQDHTGVLSSILQPRMPAPNARPSAHDLDSLNGQALSPASPPERLVAHPMEPPGPLNPTHKDFINVAQLVAEQLAMGSVNASAPLKDIPEASGQPQSEGEHVQLKSILASVQSCSNEISHCDLLKWLCVQEPIPERPNMPKGHPLAPQKKTVIPGLNTSEGAPVPMTALAPLGPPHVRVRRNEGVWDVLPPALPFWEQLGLAPAAGKKNVMAFCMYPGNGDLATQISIFVDYLGATFESCKLGAHVRATQIADINMGLVPIALSGEQTFQVAAQAIRRTCVKLGKQLAGIDWNSKLEFSPAIEDLNKIDTFVIYMVNPFQNEPRGLMELCAAFWDLYEAYSQTISSPMLHASRPDIALQVLPIRCLARPQAPVVMDGPFFQRLAREVYDRCPPSNMDRTSSRLPIESGAAIQLEHPLPRKIDFKLQAEPPTDLLHEGSNMHLGYCRSRNNEWVSVAWTDTTGKYQASSNYCLVGGRAFAEVARVIWQSTIEIMQSRRVAWRLCIARLGVLEKDELDAWSMLATSASPVVMITVIMSVDPKPPITVFHDHPMLSSRLTSLAAASTPAGTPGVSPDAALTPAATPSADAGPDVSNDPDAHLVDIGDETWGLILGHRTNTTNSILDYRPSLSTGFLLKGNAASATPLDDPDESHLNGLILVGVKLVWIGSSPKPAIAAAPQPTNQQQPPHIPIQSPFTFPQASSPSESAASPSMPVPPTPSAPPTPGGQPQSGQLNTSTSGSSIPKVTADSILRDYLQVYRNLGVLARARGLKGTKRGTLPWHVVVAQRAVEGLEASYGTMQTNS